MTYTTIQLGNLSPEAMKDPDEVQAFVKSRAGRLMLNLNDYDVKIDKDTGTVTATLRQANDDPVEVTFT